MECLKCGGRMHGDPSFSFCGYCNHYTIPRRDEPSLANKENSEEDKMAKGKNVVEADFTQVKAQEPQAVNEPSVACEVKIGRDTAGNTYYTIEGPDQSLVTISGLLNYMEKNVERFWNRTLDRNEEMQRGN